MASNFISKGADGYEAFMGRWSKRLAPIFLDFVGIEDGDRVLDVGCGTGSLTFSITERAAVASIAAIDFEEQFVEALRQQNNDPRISARQGDACALTFEDRQFDRALSLLVLHFVSEPTKAISENAARGASGRRRGGNRLGYVRRHAKPADVLGHLLRHRTGRR
jgi:ubiquinone/menaquinone biosynthesis C-methylase UbiE